MRPYNGKWNDKWNDILLIVLSLLACWFFVARFGMFGGKVDWVSQHSVIPELFRQQFYDTGNFFPDFTLQAGGGQNIYNFSYYGLYSPIVVLSYLLPFVSMSDYMIGASVVSLVASVPLLYHWLRSRKFACGVSFFVSLMFLVAGPSITQSYSQIMFVNYMPWLLIAFIGADRYLESQMRKPVLFIIGVWGMILTSFYFSIGGMLALCVYGLYRYSMFCGEEGKYIKAAVGYIFPMGIAVLLSGILLIPTAFSLMNGNHIQSGFTWKELLFPSLPMNTLFYQPYGIGLTTLIFTVLFTGLFYKEKKEHILSVLCIFLLVIPAFTWILNGGLYIRGKVWIPFLPLFCFMTANYVKVQMEGNVNKKISILVYVFTLVSVWCSSVKYKELLLADGVILLICYFLFCYIRVCKWKEWLLLFPSLCMLTLYLCIGAPAKNLVVEPEFYEKITNDSYRRLEKKVEEKMLKDAKDGKYGMYRIEEVGDCRFNAANLNRILGRHQYISSIYSSAYNTAYQNFRQNLFGVEQPFRNLMMQSVSANPMFRKLMGVRYILSEKNVIGYEKIMEDGKVAVYENKNVFPIGYVAGQENVTKRARENVDNLPITGSRFRIHKNEKTSKVIRLGRKAKKGEVLYLRLCVKNNHPDKDVAIWMNGVRNKLTARNHIYYNGNTIFSYAIALNKGAKTAKLTLGEGDYILSNVEAYIEKEEAPISYHAFQPDWNHTKGNHIEGTVEGMKNGYFLTSIPFDKNFDVYVDGQKVKFQKINEAFLGFSMGEGIHRVKIIYHAPGKTLGFVVTFGGILLFAGWMFWLVFTNNGDIVIIPLHGQKAKKKENLS